VLVGEVDLYCKLVVDVVDFDFDVDVDFD